LIYPLSAAGCQDDDCSGDYLRPLLAAAAHLLRRASRLGERELGQQLAAHLPRYILGGDEQLDVQSHPLLLDESTVSVTVMIASLIIASADCCDLTKRSRE